MKNRQKDYFMNTDRFKFRVWDNRTRKYVDNFVVGANWD